LHQEQHFTTQTRDMYVASGDIGFWEGALRDPATAQFKAVAAAVEAEGSDDAQHPFTAPGKAVSE
jgi:hypothetical protein